MKKLIFLFFCTLSFVTFAQSWTNPLTLNGEWDLYGIGDPYILKFRGTYYLYCSTKDNNVGVKCWSTTDLVNWSNAITCSTDPVTNTAYAPEVVYWNGTFYMYTSPSGGGHYVLSSSSPTGPFTTITGNLGKSIDGSIFINDDASWYFYHANENGIQGCPMSSPTTIGADNNLNAQIGNTWTEGPCVIKRNEIYYLLYTGNHVFSKGYRVDIAQNTSSPISSFTPQTSQNPILLKSEGSFVGLGHGTAFIGPDLDTYYFTYHNLAGNYGYGPYRRLDFDRMAWNGDKLLLLGPTTWSQQAPQQADVSDYFTRTTIGSNWQMPNGGNWGIYNQELMYQDISNYQNEWWYKALYVTPTAADYTAEFTIKEVHRDNNSARLGAVFSYTNEQNFGVALFHSFTNQLEVNFQINNVWGTPQLYNLPAGFNYNVWHSIRIEKFGINYKIFVDGMKKASLTSNLGAGKLGYMTSWSHGDFSYIAFSNKVNGTGIFDTYKPIPGTIEAVHYNNGGEGIGYHDLTAGNTGGMYIRNDNVDIRDCPEGGYNIGWNQTGEWFKYNVNIETSGLYNVGIRYATTYSTSQIRIWQGDTDLTGIVTLPSTGDWNNWRTFTIKGLSLIGGYQTLKIETVTGEFDLYKMQFVEADNTLITKSDDFSTASTDWNYGDGIWTLESGEVSIDGYGKATMGNAGWTNYSVQTDINYKNSMNAGIIFRVNNPAVGGAGIDPALGIDFYQGYFVSLTPTSVILGKQNYNWTMLASAAGSYALDTKYTIKIITFGANIKVYVTDMSTPKIDYTDPNPFINGKVGLRSCNVHVHFDNFTVTTTGGDANGIKGEFDDVNQLVMTDSEPNKIELFPNPVGNLITIKNITDITDLEIYKVDGQEVYRTKLTQPIWRLNIDRFNKGFYFVKLSNNYGSIITKKFIKK